MQISNDVLIGLFVLSLVIIELANVIARNRGNATLWTRLAETLDNYQTQTDKSDLIEKAMTQVIPVDVATQIIAGSQDIGTFVKRLTPDDVDRVIDALLKYQKTVLDGQPNVMPPPPPATASAGVG